MTCKCHGETFCPDLICVGMDDDVPVFVRRDSEEGRAAIAYQADRKEREQRLQAECTALRTQDWDALQALYLRQRPDDLRAENERLRQALGRIERVLQPIDDAEHTETAGRAREIAISALNIHHETKV